MSGAPPEPGRRGATIDPMDAKTRDLIPSNALGKPPGVKCHATNRAGKQCGRYAIPGGTVCPAHGGSAPQVREAARKRILTHAEQALDTLVSLLSSDSDAVRVRAAADLLDRAGLKTAEEHVLIPQEETNAALDTAIAEALRARNVPIVEADELG